jgi:RNA polymerase sigma factor (sigma-70 family)
VVTKEHVALAKRAARTFALAREVPACVDQSDLAQIALIAIHEALPRFDASLGVPLAAYLWRRMQGAMLDELRREDWAPRPVRAQLRQVERARARLEHALGRRPRDGETAAAAGLTLEALRELQRGAELPTVADDALDADPTIRIAISREVDRRPPAEQQVIAGKMAGKGGAQLASELGVSQARVSQIWTQSVGALLEAAS